MRIAGLGALLRLSLAPSALSDVVAGACLGIASGGRFVLVRTAMAAAASLAVYHAGMALNDFADRRSDALLRPERPIPAGRVSARAALAWGSFLVAVSLAAAALAGRAVLLVDALLVVLVVGYDFALKRSALSGPLALGACRGLDLLLGAASVESADLSATPVVGAATGYALFVALVSSIARREDRDEDAARARGLSWLPALPFVGGAAALPDRSGLLLALLAATWILLLVRPWSDRPAWDRFRVRGVVVAWLRGTILYGASVALGAGRPGAAAALAFLFPISRSLARRYPPT